MEKLIINVPGTPASEIVLKPGLNRFGRSLNTDFQIRHPSVSSLHCEIVAKDGTLLLRDLGSTNGTFLDGKPVTETALERGQTLRLGEVEMFYTPVKTPLPSNTPFALPETPAPPAPLPPVRLSLQPTAARAEPPLPPPLPSAPLRPVSATIRTAPKPPSTLPKTFFAALAGTFVYPFGRNGLILLATGAVFFTVLEFASGFAGMVSVGIGIFCAGYLFTFLKSIVTTSALGEDEMPSWPDYDSWVTSGLVPFFEGLAVFAVSLGPGWVYLRFGNDPENWLVWTLFIGGFLYLPMALLALAIYDNFMALNPLLVLPSIVLVPMEYAAICVILVFLALSGGEAFIWLHTSGSIPVIAPVIAEFLYLYALTVTMRTVGLLYYFKKNRLNWNLTGKQ